MINQKIKKTDSKKIKEMWGSHEHTVERYGKGFHWVESPVIMEAINRKISGDSSIDWLSYVIAKYLSHKKSDYIGLSLGCGTGILERQVQQKNLFKRIEAFDFADEVIRQAKESAHKEGLKISYHVADLNKLKLKKNYYHFIFANSVLHHLKNLEFVYNQISQALVDGGIVFINEYVGPSQFQYTDKQTEIINNILDILPKQYKKRVTDHKSLKPHFYPASIDYMNDHDPSEAVRSKEIIPLLKKKFDIIEHKDFGGSLLHMLMQDIVGNFNSKNEKDIVLLKLLIYIEEYLIKSKVIESDFSFLVVRKRTKLRSSISKFQSILKKVKS